MTAPIRVLLVDDDDLVRAGLTMMLAGAAGVEVVGAASDGRGVLAAVDRHRPDVVLMDIRMPHLDGIAATRLLRTQPEPPAVIVLTTFDADELVLRALQAGAAGFLLKNTAPADIVRAIEAGHGDPGAARQQAGQRLGALTSREHDVALSIAQGLSNAQIARQLHVSVATVKAHVSRLLTKLDLDNRVQIALLVHNATGTPPGPPTRT